MVINPKITEKLDSFEIPQEIRVFIKHILEVQDRSEMENLSSKTTLQAYEKILEQYASKTGIVDFCKNYRE